MRRAVFPVLVLALVAGVAVTMHRLSAAPGAADGPPYPLTPERLKSFGLDREFHLCTHVADGDTLDLEGLGTIRFVGVDTPEKNHATRPIEFMSLEASRFTREMCLGKKIRLEYDAWDEDFRGNYGRLLGYVYLEDGTFLQEELIRRGYSIAYTKYPFDPEMQRRFVAWEAEAREKGVGLWEDGGMAEVRWLDENRYPEFAVFGMSHRTWGIRFEGWVLPRIPQGELEDRLTELREWIYEYSPRDLGKVLRENGYRPEEN